MKLFIKDKIGKHCITIGDGQKVYDEIHESLKGGEIVTLDFEGVVHFAAPFFNFAIGQLLKDLSDADLRRLLQLQHLNGVGKLVVERVMVNSAKYYGDEDYRKIVDKVKIAKRHREYHQSEKGKKARAKYATTEKYKSYSKK